MIHEGKIVKQAIHSKKLSDPSFTQEKAAKLLGISRNYLLALMKEAKWPDIYKDATEQMLSIKFPTKAQSNVVTNTMTQNQYGSGVQEGQAQYGRELELCQQLVEQLKSQLKDKDELISILKRK